MALLFPRKRHAVLGVDISGTAVSILELRRAHTKLWVQGFAVAPFTSSTLVAHSILEPTAMIRAIQAALDQSHFSTRHVAIAMPAAAVISKTLSIDANLSEEELEAHVQLETAAAIPFSLDEVCMDFSVLGLNEKDPTKADVVWVAARRAQVEARRDVLETAGLIVDYIEVESFAVERSVNYFTYKNTLKTIAVFDLSKIKVILTVIHQRRLIYINEEWLHGSQLTESTEYLVPLLRRMMQLFISSTQTCPVDEILLSGPDVSEFVKVVSESLILPVTIIDPFQNMYPATTVNALQLQQEASSLVIACGLALRGVVGRDRD